MKKIRLLVWTFLFFSLLSLPALAADEGHMLDAEELDEMLVPFLEAHKATESNFSLGFCYTATDEMYFVNPDSAFYSASLYKVPLCMNYAEKVANGELTWDSVVSYRSLDYLVSQSLIWSDNNTAGSLLYHNTEMLYDDLGFFLYSGFSEEEMSALGGKYRFSSRMMMNTFYTLYYEQERFPRILDYLKEASPGHFFKYSLEDKYEIAQKYGEFNGVLHTAGVIYTPTPIILVVMCDRMSGQLEAIDELAVLFSDYSLTLDERYRAEEQRLAEEQAEAERLRLEKEAEAKAEEEALAAEAAAAEEAKQALVLMQEAAEKKRQNRLIVSLFALCAVALFAGLYMKKRK